MQTVDVLETRSQPPLFEALEQLLVELHERGISLKGLQLLVHLRTSGNDLKRLNVLASSIGLTGAGLTGVADLLEDRGFATRVLHREDRRAIRLTLTPKGAQFVDWVGECLSSACLNAR